MFRFVLTLAPIGRLAGQRTAALLALYVAVSALTRAVSLHSGIANADEASYVVGAWELLNGHLPYTAFADNKPPLIYVYYALTQLAAGHGIFAARLVTILVTVPMTAFAASAFYRHDPRGVAAAFAYLIYSAAYEGSNMLAVNCEVVMMLPLAWSLVLVREGALGTGPRRAFTAAILLGFATLVKYQAALWLPAVAVALGWDWWRVDRRTARVVVLALLLGFLLPLIATTIVFATLGGLEGFLYWNVIHNVGYVVNPTTLTEALRRGSLRLSAFVGVTAVLWFGVVRSFQLGTSAYWRLLIDGLFVTSLVACVVGFRFFPHYFVQLYVPLAIGSAPWLGEVLTQPLGRPGKLVATYSLAALAAFTTLNAFRYFAFPSREDAIAFHVATRLRTDPCYRQGSLFVWGSNPVFYYYAGLPLASRYFFPEYPLVSYTSGNRLATSHHLRGRTRERRGRHWRWLMADLSRSEPIYILDTAPAGLSMWEYFPLHDYPGLERFVRHRYDELDTINDVKIYRRRGCAGSLVADDPAPLRAPAPQIR